MKALGTLALHLGEQVLLLTEPPYGANGNDASPGRLGRDLVDHSILVTVHNRSIVE